MLVPPQLPDPLLPDPLLLVQSCPVVRYGHVQYVRSKALVQSMSTAPQSVAFICLSRGLSCLSPRSPRTRRSIPHPRYSRIIYLPTESTETEIQQQSTAHARVPKSDADAANRERSAGPGVTRVGGRYGVGSD